jgi:putative oxidoreductase
VISTDLSLTPLLIGV